MPLFTSEYVFSDDYPTIEPSLKLDFANARALDPRITFTRASTATYVGRDGLIKTAGEDEPRFDHDPETGESLGLLIEESRTNLFINSTSSSNWSNPNNLTKSSSKTITAPSGETDAYEWTETTDNGTHLNNGPSTSIISGNSYTISAFFKQVSGSGSGFALQWYKSGGQTVRVTYLPSTDTTTTSTSGGASAPTNVNVTSYPNGWYRISFGAALAEVNAAPIVIATDSSGATSYTGSTSNSFSFWGLQLEAGSFPTSYIPTSGSTATRAVDDAVIQGENFNSFFNPSEGSIICKYKKDHWPIAAGNDIGYERIWEIGDGTDASNLNIFNDPTQPSGNNIRYRVRTNSTNVFGPTTTTTGTNQTPTVALGYAKDNFVLVIDGTLVAADTSGDLPVVDRLHIGGRYGGDSTDRFNNTISKLFYYPKRITVAQLQTLTQ